MTLEEAMREVGFRQDDLKRVRIPALVQVIKDELDECRRFPYDPRANQRAEAYTTILKEVQSEERRNQSRD